MKKNKIELILRDIQKYKTYDFNKTVEDRLEKTFTLYMEDLENASNRLKCKKVLTVMKGLNKYGK